MLKVRTERTSTLERLLSQIQSWPGVTWTTTSVVLSVAKETLVVPLASEPSEPAADQRSLANPGRQG
jgi:Lrp/AsnC family leucine-responsive transcriptional regulator